MELGKRKKIKTQVQVINRTDKAYEGTLRIWTSNEFLIPDNKKISIQSKQTTEISFKVENIKGFKGDSYPIFVVIEYEDGEFRSFQHAHSMYSIPGKDMNIVWIMFASIAGLIILASVFYLNQSQVLDNRITDIRSQVFSFLSKNFTTRVSMLCDFFKNTSNQK